ncbi:hypothetical protein NG798_23565 [Ancylothrix sp. C2]|nr:hypothetical protein [Ancylothrix sp. D3o]
MRLLLSGIGITSFLPKRFVAYWIQLSLTLAQDFGVTSCFWVILLIFLKILLECPENATGFF